MWKTLLCVGAGSFVGGIARYGLTRWVSAGNFTHLPLGTMVVNVAGCLFIGLLDDMRINVRCRAYFRMSQTF